MHHGDEPWRGGNVINSWLKKLTAKFQNPVRKHRKRWRAVQLQLEPLEDRCLLSLVVTVNSAGDDPTGSTPGVVTLRDAITQINGDANDSSSSPDVIKFGIAGTPTITLAADLPAITNPLTIDGSTQAGVIVNGNGFLMLDVESLATATVNDVKFTGGTVGVNMVTTQSFTSGSLEVGAGAVVNVAGDLEFGNDWGAIVQVDAGGTLNVSGNIDNKGVNLQVNPGAP